MIRGRYDFRTLDQAINAGGSKAELKTESDEKLTFSNIVVMEAAGYAADVPTYEVTRSNGVIMVVEQVPMPK